MLERVWRKGTFLHCWWECKLGQPLWRTVWRFLKKLKLELPYDPAIPLLGIHTEETRIERDTCTPMFITALFTIARTGKQPRCPLADEWIRKLWYIYIMEYYPAIKKNAFESVLMRWMKRAYYTEWSKSEKHQYSILMHYMEFRKMVTMTLYARQQKRHRCIEQSFGLCGRGRGWDDLGEWHWNMYSIICETNCQSTFDAWYRMLGAGALGWPRGMVWGGR